MAKFSVDFRHATNTILMRLNSMQNNYNLTVFLISIAYLSIANGRLDFLRLCPDRLKAMVNSGGISDF